MIVLSENIKEEFKQHALEENPREACGLVGVISGKQHYFKCKNIALEKSDFVIDPKCLVRVEDFLASYAGEIVAVLHSHPSCDAKPSTLDIVSCEQSGLPWGILSLQNFSWEFFEPTGYVAPLIGRPYKHGVFDCYAALKDWYEHKLNILLPDFYRRENWTEAGDNLFMENYKCAGFKEVTDGSLEVGDAILFTIGSNVVNHCAVYIGNDQVFHQPRNRLSSREIYGGWLKKNTRMILRYSK